MNSAILNHKKKEYVWYVGYGSNLCRERFFCYIKGGQYKLGGSSCRGCRNKALPRENKTIELPHKLYFARESLSWGGGGVAFLSVEREKNQKKWTLARMWKITREQFDQVSRQEGVSWYNHTIDLGMDEGIRILTITSSDKHPLTPPSKNYLSTIVIGLIEAYKLNAKEIYDYLHQKDGVRGDFPEKELQNIINQHINAGE